MQDSGLHNYCLICPGKKLDESTVNELFKEANIKDPDWCKIDWKLWEQVSSQHTEHDHEGKEYS